MKVGLEDLVKLHQPITEDDWVVDIGGYWGDYTQAIYDRFKCWVGVFEPNKLSLSFLKERFELNPKIVVCGEALGEDKGYKKFYLKDESSSFYQEWNQSDDWVGVRVFRLSELLKKMSTLPKILKLNCEGAEYLILQDLEREELLDKIPEILVQFHKIPNWKILQEGAWRRLLKSHEKVYDYKWELYRLR